MINIFPNNIFSNKKSQIKKVQVKNWLKIKIMKYEDDFF